jgi:pimeloyl-ACP methyl ester carboxylesterase
MPWTFPFLGETVFLNEATRSSTPGSFVRLSDGYTHYELGSSSILPAKERKGEALDKGARVPVVLVHGFSVPYFIWDPTFEFLAVAGFHVLRYDLFGRGFSDRPNTRYDIDLFSKQLRELLDTLDFEQINLIGLSMGGPISATFAARYPDRVQTLVLIDPAGARPVAFAQLLKAATAPGIGELVLGLFGRGWLSGGVKSDFHDPALIKAFVDRYMIQMKYKGFMRAILSTMRNGMLGNFSETYRKVGEQGTRTLLLWGRDDRTVPFSHSNDIRAAIPQAEFHAFERCGHIPHYEKPQEANPVLLEFLK